MPAPSLARGGRARLSFSRLIFEAEPCCPLTSDKKLKGLGPASPWKISVPSQCHLRNVCKPEGKKRRTKHPLHIYHFNILFSFLPGWGKGKSGQETELFLAHISKSKVALNQDGLEMCWVSSFETCFFSISVKSTDISKLNFP